MNKKIEYKGKWYLPDRTDIIVSGTLTYMPNNPIVLEVIGGLSNEGDIFDTVNAQKNFNIIHGDAYNISNNNFNKITLINCTGGWTFNTESNFPIIRYNVQCCLVGTHINSFEDKIFDKAVARIGSLSEWCNPGIINTYFPTEEGKIIGNGIFIDLKKLKEPIVSTKINDSLQLTIAKDLDSQTNNLNVSMTQHTEIEISPATADKMTIGYIRQKLHIFEQFISFISLCNVYASKITLYDYTKYQEFSNGKKIYKKIEFYVNQEKSDTPKELLAKYHEIANVYPDMIKKWYDVTEDIAPIRNHLVRSLKHRTTFDSTDFVLVAHALEGYYLRFVDNKRQQIEQRYKELLKRFQGLTMFNHIQFDAQEAADSRNYYSHFFIKKQTHKVLEGPELYELYRKMRVLLICCILELMGHDMSSINKIVSSSSSDIFKF